MAARGTRSKSSSRRGKPQGGRVTPKGGPAAAQAARARRDGAAPSGSSRYTPPLPRSAKSSPPWWPALIFGPIAVGMLTIVLNYAHVFPGGTSSWYLVPGLALITGGIIAATYYR